MQRIIGLLLTVAFFVLQLNVALDARPSSYPFIAGDTFRDFCDHLFDETSKNMIPENVKFGDAIFLKTDYLSEFFSKIHPRIPNPYVLVTHNSDYDAPRGFGYILDDPKLLAWYGQNVMHYEHPKLHPIPIGIANRYWRHGSIDAVAEAQSISQGCDRPILLFMNFSKGTHSDRNQVYQKFCNQPFCFVSPPKDFKSYLCDLAHSKFVLSPRGNGLDCHRTWEALLMGAIPIVISSSIDSLFEGLPVVIIQDWDEVTQEFLEAKWAEMSEQKFALERMYAQYWLDLIASHKQEN